MRRDPDASVVDPDGRGWSVPGLTVSSVFPSALAANPALTVIAVALRTADRFLDRARRLDA